MFHKVVYSDAFKMWWTILLQLRYLLSRRWKNFENQSTLGIAAKIQWDHFSEHGAFNIMSQNDKAHSNERKDI